MPMALPSSTEENKSDNMSITKSWPKLAKDNPSASTKNTKNVSQKKDATSLYLTLSHSVILWISPITMCVFILTINCPPGTGHKDEHKKASSYKWKPTCSTLMSNSPWTFLPLKTFTLHMKQGVKSSSLFGIFFYYWQLIFSPTFAEHFKPLMSNSAHLIVCNILHTILYIITLSICW